MIYTILFRIMRFFGENRDNTAVITPQYEKLIRKSAEKVFKYSLNLIRRKAVAVIITASIILTVHDNKTGMGGRSMVKEPIPPIKAAERSLEFFVRRFLNFLTERSII